MIGTFKSFVHYFREHPLRGVLTIATIAIGVGVLIISLSLSVDVASALNEQLSRSGRRIVIANGHLSDDGSVERQMPPTLDASAVDLLEIEIESLSNTTTVSTARVRGDSFEASDRQFEARSIIAAGPEYASWAEMEMIAGDFFTADDEEARSAVIVISSGVASRVFGSAEAAVGQKLSFAQPQLISVEGGGFRARGVQAAYTVLGVFEEKSELERVAYAIGDLIMPSTTNVPVGFDLSFDPTATIVATVTGESPAQAQARITELLQFEYGADTEILVWEGSPYGPAAMIDDSREAVTRFTVAINVLGVIVLLASSLGIFSIMLVEVLNRMREIGLRRALGATQAGIRRFFMAQALYLTLVGGAIGIGLSMLFYRPVARSLAPFFEGSGLSIAEVGVDLPGALPTLGALAFAMTVGVFFGFFPAVGASRTPIVECIREEAA